MPAKKEKEEVFTRYSLIIIISTCYLLLIHPPPHLMLQASAVNVRCARPAQIISRNNALLDLHAPSSLIFLLPGEDVWSSLSRSDLAYTPRNSTLRVAPTGLQRGLAPRVVKLLTTTPGQMINTLGVARCILQTGQLTCRGTQDLSFRGSAHPG